MAERIVNFVDRVRCGSSRPFLCEGESGRLYYVKRDNLGWTNLVAEFLVTSLAEKSGLAVPPHALVEIPSELARLAPPEERGDFQPGLAFASQQVPFAEELRSSHLRSVPEDTQLRCLCFDWWTRNAGRRLGRAGGDANLLWEPAAGKVRAIDHARALDPDFPDGKFFREHPCRDARAFLDRSRLERYRTSFESALYGLGELWEQIPDEWLRDVAGAERTPFSLRAVEAMLIDPELPVDGPLP